MWYMNILDEETDLPNKAGEAYQRLYHEEWRSSQLLTVSEGKASFRGFHGQYLLRLLKGSEVLVVKDFLLEDDLQIVCTEEQASIVCF